VELSPTELVQTDVVDWVPAERIIDSMRNYFRVFDDSLANPVRMNSQIWFRRVTKTPCTVCNRPYLPHLERQRYCHDCKEWIHLSCLTAEGDNPFPDFKVVSNQQVLDIEKLGEDGVPKILDAVLSRPTVRGHGGIYDFDNNWLNTGSGVQKELVLKWKGRGRVPENWLELLGENFLEDFVIGKSWKSFPCIKCGGLV
jgi:hypothetical protein